MPMKAVLLQQNIVWADPDENTVRLSALLADAPQADLYVLPEMFTTGFATEPVGVAEEEPAKGLEWMKSFAAERDCAVAGSIALHVDGGYVNRHYFVTPQGVHWYDKRHLFTYGGEDKTFTRGTVRKIVEWRGVRFLLTVCYDLRFPVWSRNRDDYDAIICVANWPQVRQFAWNTLTRARSIENQCFMLAVNRCGEDPKCIYEGGTAIIDPYGATVAGCEPCREQYIVAELDMEGLASFRQKFPVIDDADNFEIL